MAMSDFKFTPAEWIPFRDMEAVERVRAIKREDIEKHPNNPDFNIEVVRDCDLGWIFVSDIVARIKESDEQNKPIALIMPNPCHAYAFVARMINRMKINCRNVHLFAMDEWADQDGNIAPETWDAGFGFALLKWLYYNIDEELRMPREQVNLFTNENVENYSKMIIDGFGGADACYSGPGWAGHIAFIDPLVDDWSDDLEEWKTQGAHVAGLNPLTIAQNSLHGCFGMSGDLTAVPPKCATIGPYDVVNSKFRMEIHGLTTMGTFSSWQRMISRLCIHGPVTPLLPSSLHQILKTDLYITETQAADIKPYWDLEY